MKTANSVRTKYSKMTATKWKLFVAAVELFATRGYANVGVRDIAEVVGIKSASIYNHFPSKDALLAEAYQFFYDNYTNNLMPTEKILEMIPENHPHEILEELLPPFGGRQLYDLIKKIILIALERCNSDPRAEELVSKIYANVKKRVATVLTRMIELGIIEPLDIDLFVSVFVRFSISAASYANGRYDLSFKKWQAGRQMLFGLVREKRGA